MARGMDFNGNTSSTVARLLSSEGGTDVFSDVSSSDCSDVFSVTVNSVEIDDVVVFKST